MGAKPYDFYVDGWIMAKPAIGVLKEKASVLIQKIVRLKAADCNGYCQCVSCGVVKHWKEMQGGHYVPRGNSATRLMEENVHPQCKGCNGYGMKYGDAEKHYTLYMIDMYGRDFVEHLLSLKGKPHKWSRCDLEDMIIDFKAQIKELEANIAGQNVIDQIA